MNVQEIEKIIKSGEYEFYGIRVDSENRYNIGDTCKNSHNWFQDDPEDGSEYNSQIGLWDCGELDGTCCIKVTEDNIEYALNRAEAYFGDLITLIAGDYAEGGSDIGEIIIKDAVVLAKVKGV